MKRMLGVFTMLVALLPLLSACTEEQKLPETFAITVEAGEGGKVMVAKSLTRAAKGVKVVFTVSAATGYEIDKIAVSGVNLQNEGATQSKTEQKKNFVMPGRAVTIQATFKALPIPPAKILVKYTKNDALFTVKKGTEALAPNAEVKKDDEITITPAAGKQITVKVNGTEVAEAAGAFTYKVKGDEAEVKIEVAEKSI